ncbi:hypothetical protein [Sphingobacterium kitahiroshimense]|uniref:Uncharacterized protein n=1 Tax=Sphingobacterium kitahiroshimense TaxID=470446 RepID=A0ABV0C0C9_9SPHI
MEKINKGGKVLIIYDSIDYFIPFMEIDGVDVVRLYKKRNFLITLLKKIFLYFGWFNRSWYGDWIFHLNEYSKVIIFATKDYSVIEHIYAVSNAKIYFWYWNPAFRMGFPKKNLFDLAEVWSFDPLDCEKYNLKFNTTFFFKKIQIGHNLVEYDILFLGINKGRRTELDKLNQTFLDSMLKTYFYIVPDKNENGQIDNKPIPYHEYLELVSKSKAILDIQPVGQTGLTLRPMESLFFKKKLITNNQNIVSELFYNNHNIFILGKDNINSLQEFLQAPYEDISEEIVDKFDFSSWLKRFEL